MEKPTIFFSHSSKDEMVLRRLKEKVSNILGGSIDIFLSSDGQSIPFGKNWVHKIEEALSSSSIMFVFISPNSIQSNWIYFESGFSYSKGVEVVPIGILGIDLNQISPPLSLLQGFNIESKDGLNNIISILNIKFSHSHKEAFSDKDYNEIFISKLMQHSGATSQYFKDIDFIKFTFHNSIKWNEKHINIKPNPLGLIQSYLRENDIEFGDVNSKIYLRGAKIEKKKAGAKGDKVEVDIYIDPMMALLNFPVVKDLLELLYEGYQGKYFLNLYFEDSISIIDTSFKMSSRLYDYNIKISKELGNLFKYENILFVLENEQNYIVNSLKSSDRNKLRVVYPIEELDNIPLFELLDILYESGLIY